MYSQMKIVGTIATVGGAMLMTLVKGPAFELFSPKSHSTHQLKKIDISLHDAIKGSFMMFVGCFCLASFMILQAITLKEYPAELSLTAWICLLGSIEGTALALVMEKGNYSVWSLSWDSKLLASLYGGVLCSGLAYYIQGIIMKKRGPVFVTAFNPLSMVIVAILSSLILAENMYLGRVVGAAVIIGGLYLVIWGKSKDYEPTPTEADQEKAISKEQYEDEAMDATNSKHEQFQSQNA